MLDRCHWLNEPASWTLGPDGLAVVTDHGTDFWRLTHYGFTRHTGHMFGYQAVGGFTATVRVRGQYKSLYDQAGLMVLLDEENWIKTGIEFSDGACLLGSVVTQGHSDWATGVFHGDPSDFWIRTTVNQGVLRIQASTDGLRWPMVRLCPIPLADHYIVGPMCCSPERAGLEVLFSEFTVTPPTDKALHDLS
jgi:regulation of enolase protein 1 (concanavalin A-like superfamily)